MDQKVVKRLEREIEKAVSEVILTLNLKKLPLLPPNRTMQMMARAAVAVYEAEVDRPDDGPPKHSGSA
jgi:hypothetical protein